MKVIFRMQLFHNLLSLTFTKHSVFPCDLSAQIVQTKYSTLIEMCEIQTRKKIYHRHFIQTSAYKYYQGQRPSNSYFVQDSSKIGAEVGL